MRHRAGLRHTQPAARESSPRSKVHALRRRIPARAVLLLAVALVGSLAAPPAGAAGRDHTSHERVLAWWVAQEMATARSDRGVAPLTGYADIDAVARDWSDELAGRGRLEHNPHYGDQMCCWQRAGEVLATVTVADALDGAALRDAARRTVGAWLDSGGHRGTLLDARFDDVGVGVTIDYATGRAWVTADLRDRASGSDPGSAVTYRAGDPAPADPRAGLPCGDDGDAFGEPAHAIDRSLLGRLAGADRVETALVLSGDVTETDTVLLASAGGFADSLAAAGLAGRHRAPLLLTGAARLDGRVADRLADLQPREVLLLGGDGALSPAVADDVRRILPGSKVERLSGSSRFGTAAATARRLARDGGDTSRVVLVLGDHHDPGRAWPDGVSASALAAAHHHPVLLTRGGELPAASRRALGDLGPDEVVVVGGTRAISPDVVDEVEAVTGARVVRAAGASRYGTSVAVAELDQRLRGGPVVDVMLADGTDWPDALTAGPAAARRGAVLLLVDGGADGSSLPAVDAWIDRHWRLRVTLAGGDAAISAAREGDLRRRLPCL